MDIGAKVELLYPNLARQDSSVKKNLTLQRLRMDRWETNVQLTLSVKRLKLRPGRVEMAGNNPRSDR